MDIARRLHLTVVCEGIENAAQAELVRELGCDFGQGYFYSKPVSARHCRALLEQLRLERPLTDTLLARTLPRRIPTPRSGVWIRSAHPARTDPDPGAIQRRIRDAIQ